MLDALLKAHVQRGLRRQLPPHVVGVELDLVTQRRPCDVPGPHDLDEAAKETSEGWVRGAGRGNTQLDGRAKEGGSWGHLIR